MGFASQVVAHLIAVPKVYIMCVLWWYLEALWAKVCPLSKVRLNRPTSPLLYPCRWIYPDTYRSDLRPDGFRDSSEPEPCIYGARCCALTPPFGQSCGRCRRQAYIFIHDAADSATVPHISGSTNRICVVNGLNGSCGSYLQRQVVVG